MNWAFYIYTTPLFYVNVEPRARGGTAALANTINWWNSYVTMCMLINTSNDSLHSTAVLPLFVCLLCTSYNFHPSFTLWSNNLFPPFIVDNIKTILFWLLSSFTVGSFFSIVCLFHSILFYLPSGDGISRVIELINGNSLSQEEVELIMQRLLEKQDLDEDWEMVYNIYLHVLVQQCGIS